MRLSMSFRISATIFACFVPGAGLAQAPVVLSQVPSLQMRSPIKWPDPREEFVRLCMPHMAGRWAHPETGCGCRPRHAAAVVEDSDLRAALLRGISETGVPNIETDW